MFSIGLIPLLTEWGFAYASEIIQMLLGLVLLASLLSIVNQRLLSGLLFVVSLMVVLKLLYLASHINVILPSSNIAQVFFCLIATILILQFVMKTRRVNNDVVFASLSVYLLFGLIFGYIYFMVEEALPHSLVHNVTSASFEGGIHLSQAIYFSFVTLATLGYGDIIPASDVIRSLAITQTMIGQVYLVVLVARLVTLYGGNNKK